LAYNANIPQPTDRKNDSQDDLLQNFTALSTFLNTNHVDLNAIGEGKHKFVEFPKQTSDPAAVTDEVFLFARESTYTANKVVLSYRQDSGADGKIYDIGDGGATAGWSLLPSGLLMKWGFLNWTTAMAQDVQFVIPFANSPSFSPIVYVNFHPLKSASSDLDAHVRYQAFSTGPQEIDVYVTKRTDSTKPTESFNFWYLIFGAPV